MKINRDSLKMRANNLAKSLNIPQTSSIIVSFMMLS